MSAFVLYGNRDSGHSYKVSLMLALASIPHDYHEIDLDLPRAARPEPFRSLAKFGEVPLLLDDGHPYVQSNAILLHLAEYTGAFGGGSRQRLKRVREWLFWEANRIGFSLANLRYNRKPGKAGAGVAADGQDMLRQRFNADIATLEAELADGRAFMLDDHASVADISLCGYMYWAEQAEVLLPRNVQRWLERISELPGWRHPYAIHP